MRRGLVLGFVVALGVGSSALALPGQTPAQLIAWGKSNVSLHGFKATMDQETADTDYTATLRIDGSAAAFSSEPLGGIARREYIDFNMVGDLAKKPALLLDTIRTVYGAAYAADFQNAVRVPLQGHHQVAWQGAKLGYVTFEGVLLVATNAEFRRVLQNIRSCDSIECSD